MPKAGKPLGGNLRIVYAGWNKDTLFCLCDDFQVCAAGHIDAFEQKTCNPANLLFKAIYALRRRGRWRAVETALLAAWKVVGAFSSSIFWDYRAHLPVMVKNKIDILDFTNIKGVTDYIAVNKIDLLVVNTWEILPKEIIFAPRLGTVNIHPSLLPRYRGALPELWVLKNHDAESAVTYMLIDGTMDGGRILRQHRFPVSGHDTWKTILEKQADAMRRTLADDLADYANGRIVPHEQDKTLVSFTAKFEAYREIDWKKETCREIYNKINMYHIPKQSQTNYPSKLTRANEACDVYDAKTNIVS